MPQSSQHASRHLQSRIIAFLRKAGWGNRNVVERRFDTDYREPISGSELSHWMEDYPFGQTLFRLPACLSYLRRVPYARYPNQEDRAYTVGQGAKISFFLSSFYSELCQADLWNDILDAIWEMLDSWNSTFEEGFSLPCPGENAESPLRVVHFIPTATFLEELMGMVDNRSNVHHALIQRWAGSSANPESSANLLSLLLQIKLQTQYVKLACDPLIREASVDAHLCQRHWTTAEKLLRTKCPVGYVENLAQSLPIF